VNTLVVTPPLFDHLGGEPTLDGQLVGAWEGLAAQETVECPMCGGAMEPEESTVEGGRCTACGTTLR
jgi:hypothetical protein